MAFQDLNQQGQNQQAQNMQGQNMQGQNQQAQNQQGQNLQNQRLPSREQHATKYLNDKQTAEKVYEQTIKNPEIETLDIIAEVDGHKVIIRDSGARVLRDKKGGRASGGYYQYKDKTYSFTGSTPDNKNIASHCIENGNVVLHAENKGFGAYDLSLIHI